MAVVDLANSRSHRTSAIEIRDMIVAELAEIQAMERSELESEILEAGGDDQLEVDSPQAEAILSRLEAFYDRELPGPEDLDPEQFTTIRALVNLVVSRLSEPESARGGVQRNGSTDKDRAA
ncbi:MAG: hypothetical protein QOF33_679 [Thermomicrobiales bacterium]|nr:hypothetical protein [Thermomicrobiales bacterium]